MSEFRQFCLALFIAHGILAALANRDLLTLREGADPVTALFIMALFFAAAWIAAFSQHFTGKGKQ